MKTRRIATRAIIFKDGKLLAQRLTPGDDGKARTYWCTPGGGLDIGEPLEIGLHREMIEETGIAPKIGRLLFVQQFSEDGEKEQLEFFFHVENPEDYEVIDLASTTHGHIEVEHIEFVDPRKENVLPKFLQSIDIQHYIDTVQAPLIYNELK
ncbi:MAG TPA: NUDIX domain-containing protein [Candidatus Saccharimonadales bacterium]